MDITEGSAAREEIAAAGGSAQFLHQQEQIKKGWSLLNTLHCLLLSGTYYLSTKNFPKIYINKLGKKITSRLWQGHTMGLIVVSVK